MAKERHFGERTFVPCLSISPHRCAVYSRPIDGFRATSRHSANAFNLQDNDHEGIISAKAARKIENHIAWLLFKAKPKFVTDRETGKRFSFVINFITLTLPAPQVHSDNEIKKRCLQNFLSVARKHGLENYLWRAEAQPNTGNIHFHITTDKYIHYSDINRWWNQSLQLLGYIDAFFLKHKHRNPNSSDVHSVKDIRNVTSYLCKYLGKNKAFPCVGELRLIEGEVKEVFYSSVQYKSEAAKKKAGKVIGHILGSRVRPIKGRLWGASESLSKIKPLVINGELHDLGVFFEFFHQSGFRKYTGEFATLYFGDISGEAKTWFPQLFKALSRQIVN